MLQMPKLIKEWKRVGGNLAKIPVCLRNSNCLLGWEAQLDQIPQIISVFQAVYYTIISTHRLGFDTIPYRCMNRGADWEAQTDLMTCNGAYHE